MAFLGLCSDDSLLKTLREVVGANPIRVPEWRIQPLVVLASNGHTTSFRGSLGPLLKGAPSLQVDVAESPMADLSGTRSRHVDASLGLQILEGFLSGLGLPSAGVTAKFTGAKKVSFAFQGVVRRWVDPAIVGLRLTNQIIDAAQPAATIFLDGGYQFLVVDSTIQSDNFDIKIESSSTVGFALDIPAIQDLVGKAKAGVTVDSASSLEVSFKGPRPLSFAFSCLRLYVDGNGKVTSMPPADNVPGLASAIGAPSANLTTQALYTPDRILLSPVAGLTDLQFPQE